jgi:hypothetical protein
MKTYFIHFILDIDIVFIFVSQRIFDRTTANIIAVLKFAYLQHSPEM